MARTKKNEDEVEEVFQPDFEAMKKAFIHDIKPSDEKNAKARGDLSATWKAIEDDYHCNKRAAKLLYKLYNESEETRDDFLRTLLGGLEFLSIGISEDLVDQMNAGNVATFPTRPAGLGTDGLAALQ